MRGIKNIIWDWNGTLLDDVSISIESINQLLFNRGLPILDRERYLGVFDFPVKNYYQQIGFDFNHEPFEIPANQFIGLYYSKLKNACLHSEISNILQYFKQKELQQYILSAAEETKLKEALIHFGIAHYFNDVTGLDHDYANSKLELGRAMLERNLLVPSETCMVGDTVHDFDVANELGCRCIIIANGHQSYEKLAITKTKVYKDIGEFAAEF